MTERIKVVSQELRARELLAAAMKAEWMEIYRDHDTGEPPPEESWLQRADNSPASLRAIVAALPVPVEGEGGSNLFNIEHGIPIPRRVAGAHGVPKTIYPFAKMKIGDSFFVPITDESERDRRQNSILGTARRSKYCKGMHFTTRRELGGIRVWRVAPPASLPEEGGGV